MIENAEQKKREETKKGQKNESQASESFTFLL